MPERLQRDDPLALLRGDLGPVVRVGGVGQILVLLELLANGREQVVGRYAARINGLDAVALTKLDVLDQCETLKVCVAYRHRGETLTDFPEDENVVAEAEPVYEEIEGWRAPTIGAKNEADLPAKAQRYLERLEELIGTPFCLISTGAQRDETILCEDSPLMRWFPSVRSSLQ